MSGADFRIGEVIVRPQRDCIKRSGRVIHVAPKSMSVLLCLANARGEVVSRQELFECVWPGAVVSDDALTQRIAELRKAFGDTAYDPQFIETVPKIGFRLIPPLSPLPEKTSKEPGSAKASIFLDWRAISAFALVAALVIVTSVWWSHSRTPDPQPGIPSIAVLPFKDLSASGDIEYFCSGISETILHMLAQSPDLLVASGTSSFQPQLKNLSSPEIADLLGVDTILEGSIQPQGERIRITAQLIDAKKDIHLWSGSFERDGSDVFSIQDDIAAAVTSALKIAVIEDGRKRIYLGETDNVDAYDSFMKAKNLADSGQNQEAIGFVEKAIRQDPEYVRAYVLLGELHMAYDTWPDIHVQEKVRRGHEIARKAIELAPDMPAALVLLAAYTEDQELKGQLLRRAYENGPNDINAIMALAQYLIWDPDPAQSEALAQKALALDPLQQSSYATLTLLEIGQKRVDNAFKIIETWKGRFPDSSGVCWMEALAYFVRGQYRSQLETLIRAAYLQPENPLWRLHAASAYLLAGLPEQSRLWSESISGPGRQSDWYRRIQRTQRDLYFQRDEETIYADSRQLLLDGIMSNSYRGPVLTWFLEYGARLDRMDEVLGTLETLYPHLFSDPPQDLKKDKLALYATAFALLKTGDREKGEHLMRTYFEIQDREDMAYHQVYPWSIDGRLALGDTEDALEKFRKFADVKWVWAGNTAQLMFQHSSLYDPIRDEPEFAELLTLYDHNAAEQRRLIAGSNLRPPSE